MPPVMSHRRSRRERPWTALQETCATDDMAGKGVTRRIRQLVLHDDVNQTTSIGNTPLHLACANGDADLVATLISHSADVNAVNKSYESPLHHAVHARNMEAIDLLLAAGADVDEEDIECQTPLHWAMDRANEGCQVIRTLLAAGARIDARDYNVNTPLHLAAAEGAMEAVKLLLERGAPHDLRNAKGLTPFFSAIHRDQDEVVAYLAELEDDATKASSGTDLVLPSDHVASLS